ncbi:hypothetical protein DMENIID0001_066630 [Sergentomyia squamirostris]
MKLIVAFALVTVCVSSLAADTAAPRDLKEDFEEFVALIPFNKINDVVIKYIILDGEFRSFVKYLQSGEFGKVWDQIFSHHLMKDLLRYLDSKDVDAVGLINQLADLIGQPHVNPDVEGVLVETKILGGVKAIFEEIIALINIDQMEALILDKLANSPAFQELYNKISSIDYAEIDEFLENSAEIQDFLQRLRKYGITVDDFIYAIKEFFGWL